MFKKYVSNVALGTGTNYRLRFSEKRTIRVRAYLRPEICGDFDWRIFYINQVNSTFSNGADAYRGLPGGEFTIVRAAIADGGEITDATLSPDTKLDFVSLTFGGNPSRVVAPDEHVASDPVHLSVADNHYLAFEWELFGDSIPCTPDSQAAAWTDVGDGFKYAVNCPLPAMFACDRPYKKRVAFLGDSITQGCGTPVNGYGMWAARIAAMLDQYAVWNIGLGYGRGSDCVNSPSWLYKAKQNDIVIMTFGVNDVLHGAYNEGRPASAGEVIETLETLIEELKSARVEVILSTVPPFDFTPEKYREWRAVNLAIPRIAQMHGCRVFDIESVLDQTDTLSSRHIYGAHPDEIGGKVAAEKFWKTFFDGQKWTL